MSNNPYHRKLMSRTVGVQPGTITIDMHGGYLGDNSQELPLEEQTCNSNATYSSAGGLGPFFTREANTRSSMSDEEGLTAEGTIYMPYANEVQMKGVGLGRLGKLGAILGDAGPWGMSWGGFFGFAAAAVAAGVAIETIRLGAKKA